MSKRILGPLLLAVGYAGFAVALYASYKGMRDVMVQNGGFCASGGPYAIAQGHQCSSSDTELLMFGILGMFVFGAIALGASGWVFEAIGGPGLAMWGALFGVLGVNFLTLGFSPPHGQSASGGWIVCGVVFELMALGGVVPAIGMAAGWVRRGGKPEPPLLAANERAIVRAAIPHD